MAATPRTDKPPPLSQSEIEAISERLRNGEYLDDQYRDRLFRQPKEYELVYAAKESRGNLVASTMGVPLQTLRRFGEPRDGWSNKLVFGDNLQVLKTLFEMKERGDLVNADGTPGVRLCYIDPPFASLREFKGQKGEKAYADRIAGSRFVEFLRKRLILIRETLADDGVICVHLDWRKSHYGKVILDEVFGEQNFQNEIVWHYSGWNKKLKSYFERRHDVLLYYSKTATPRFNSYAQPWESKEEYVKVRKQELLVDDDGREYVLSDAGGGKRVQRYIEEAMAAGRPSDDVWKLDKINNSSKEAVGYPTQKPKALLERIVGAFSDPGDVVLDCFVGSGTTAVVAEKLGRRWIAVDCGKLAIYTTQKRLLSGSDGFDLCTAGLYDNDLLEKLSFPEFEVFCLDLFGCRPQKHTISGVPMAGTRKGAPVHFFAYDQTDALMGREYVESLHERIGSKISGSVCIVAPVAACDPGLFEDIVQVGEVSYFILRVPYSVIEALHDRGFEHIEQPASEEDINNPLDVYGFDFIELPEVKTRRVSNRDEFRLHIESFMRGGLDPDDFEELEDAGRVDLAMVMVDAKYDGELFRLSHWQFADELKNAEWTLSLPFAECGERLMVVFLDTHGNERREIMAPSAEAKPKTSRTKKAPSKSKKKPPAKVKGTAR